MLTFLFMVVVSMFIGFLILYNLENRNSEFVVLYSIAFLLSTIVTVHVGPELDTKSCEPQQVEQSAPIKQEMVK